MPRLCSFGEPQSVERKRRHTAFPVCNRLPEPSLSGEVFGEQLPPDVRLTDSGQRCHSRYQVPSEAELQKQVCQAKLAD